MTQAHIKARIANLVMYAELARSEGDYAKTARLMFVASEYAKALV